MRSPALAIAWDFRRHLWALPVFALYLFATGVVVPAIYGPGQPVQLDPPNGMGALLVVPLSLVFSYFLAVFSYGTTGDLSARHSIFPARQLTLPVSTAALAGWPMLYGAIAMIGMWLVLAFFARWPWGLELPLLWPALLAAVLLAWMQVLTWMPYGFRGVRVTAAVLWLATLDAVVIAAVHYEASERLMVTFLLPQLPLAYLGACVAVGRARSGDVPDWGAFFSWFRSSTRSRSRRLSPFTSANRAQAWFEWRRHGWSLPAMVGLLLPFELGLLFVPVVVTPPFLYSTLLAVLLTPPVMAGFVAATLRKANPHVRDWSGLTPLDATRPFTTAAMVGAKLGAALWSTLAAWLLVSVAVPPALMLADAWDIVIERLDTITAHIGLLRAMVIALLVAVGLVASTWKRLVQSLCIGLAGRRWIATTSGFAALVFVMAAGPAIEWIWGSTAAQRALWEYWMWILAGLVAFKMVAAVWVAVLLCRSRLLSDRALVIGAAGWVVTVLALYGVLVWLTDTAFLPRYILALVAILLVPLARLSAAPLALAWNRHR